MCVESRMHVSSFGVAEPSAGEGGGGVGWALCILSGLSVYLLSVHFCHNIKQAV